jgi:uncharacterized membrane protein
VVTLSTYAEIFGISVALLGSLFYLTLLLLLVAYFDSKKTFLISLASILPLGAFLFSSYLVYVQAMIIKSWCIYCLVSATCSTLLFILGMILLQKIKKSTSTPAAS